METGVTTKQQKQQQWRDRSDGMNSDRPSCYLASALAHDKWAFGILHLNIRRNQLTRIKPMNIRYTIERIVIKRVKNGLVLCCLFSVRAQQSERLLLPPLLAEVLF